MEKFKKFIDFIDKITTWITCCVVGIMVLMVSLQVISRYIFHNSLSFTEELARYMFIWSVFMGSVLAMNQRKHVGMTFFAELFKGTAKRVEQLIADICTNIFFLLLLVFGSLMVKNAIAQYTPALNISFSLVYLAVPVAAVGLLVNCIYITLENWKNFKKDPKGKE